MRTPEIVGRRKPLRTPAEFQALGARLDRELSVVRPFVRKRGFAFKAHSWNELAHWESQPLIKDIASAVNERAGSLVAGMFAA